MILPKLIATGFVYGMSHDYINTFVDKALQAMDMSTSWNIVVAIIATYAVISFAAHQTYEEFAEYD